MRIHLTLVLTLLTSALFAGGSNVSAVGRNGVSYFSIDRGMTWQVGNSNTQEYINGVATDHYGNFWAVGASGQVLKSEDYGAGYSILHELTDEIFNAIDIDQQGRIVIVGANGSIYVSDNLGSTFDKVGPDTDVNLLDVNIDNPDLWVAVGVRGMVFTSEDSGKTWVAIEEVFGSSNFNTITYTTEGTFIIAGTLGALFTSKDGHAWNPGMFEEGFKSVIEDLASDSNGDTYAVGWNGAAFHSSDQGESWTRLVTGDTQRLTAITLSGSRVVMVGFRSTILSGNGNEWILHDDFGRDHLMEVATNDLPDLTVDMRRVEGCSQIEITVSNRGPGRLTEKPYTDSNVGVLISSENNNKHVYYISLSDLDPGEKLKNKGTVLKHTIDLNISSPLNVRWGLNGIVKDLDLTNNSASIGECISK